MNREPLVSIIVATKNEEKNIVSLCESVSAQSYKNVELIVVDNGNDRTKELALKYTEKVFSCGPERCSQRNFGLEKASGEYVLFLDADMRLSCGVVGECVSVMSVGKDWGEGEDKVDGFFWGLPDSTDVVGVVIPEISVGEGFWAECVALEKSFYVGAEGIEAARFFKTNIVREAGGYDSNLVSGEDWDLHKRISRLGKIGRIKAHIYHHEGRPGLRNLVSKKAYYAKHFDRYLSLYSRKETSNQVGILNRYWMWLSRPVRLFKNPIVGLGMLFMKTCEFGVGGLVWFRSRIRR